jgi:uncharacterized membrane protein
MLIGLHGTSIAKVLLILSGNYLIAKTAGKSKLGPLATWVFILSRPWVSWYVQLFFFF